MPITNLALDECTGACVHTRWIPRGALVTWASAVVSVVKVNSLVNICQQFLNLKYSRPVQIKIYQRYPRYLPVIKTELI